MEYANLAVRGFKAGQVRESQLDAAAGLRPDIVTITAGMNDILRPRVDFEALRATLSELAMRFSVDAKVLFVPIPNLTAISPAGRLVDARRMRLNSIYRELCTN